MNCCKQKMHYNKLGSDYHEYYCGKCGEDIRIIGAGIFRYLGKTLALFFSSQYNITQDEPNFKGRIDNPNEQ